MDEVATNDDHAKYRIGMVARLTGLTTHNIRVWERRHGAVHPVRSEGGGRLYNDADVERLRMLKALTDRGHSIGGIAGISDEELRGMLGGAEVTQPEDDSSGIRDGFLEAVLMLDMERAEHILTRAAVVLSPRELLREVVGPIFEEVGRRWEEGEFRVAHEHAASSLLRNLLGTLMRLHTPDRGAPLAVAATPAGEQHEFGALMASMLAAIHGWRVIYLGSSLPPEELVHAVERSRARLLLVSIVNGEGDPEAGDAVQQLHTLRRALNDRVRIICGGRATPEPPPEGVIAAGDLDTLEVLLRDKR